MLDIWPNMIYISPDLNMRPLAAFFYFFAECSAALDKKRKKAARGVRFKSGLDLDQRYKSRTPFNVNYANTYIHVI